MLKFITIVLLFLSLLNASDKDEYSLGSGVQIGSAPLYVGGYISTDYQYNSNDSQNQFRIDDIAFLAYGSYEKVSYLAEIEFRDYYIYQWDSNGSDSVLNDRLHIERLYLDYLVNDEFTFRVGKFNSPIGYWNLTPINVLRDTSSNPMLSYILYPKFTTGVDLTYNYFGDYEFKLDLMLQRSEDIDGNYNNIDIDEHYGLGLEISKDDWSLKANGGYFHALDKAYENQNFYYALVGGEYEDDKYKFTAELATQLSESKTTIDYITYFKALYKITDKQMPVMRIESYKSSLYNLSEDDTSLTIGYTYRPLFPVAIKGEYQFHTLDKYDKLYISFSVMF